jgi:CubicO group peptidase (beta-lactamase class C family)
VSFLARATTVIALCAWSLLWPGSRGVLAQGTGAIESQGTTPITPADLENLIDHVVREQLDRRRIAGAVVTVVNNGAVVLTKGYGVADVAQRRAMTPDSLVRIGSVTKLLTALAVMQLVETGALDLDRDINQYVDFGVPTTVGRSPVTLRRLLSHQTGFEDRRGEIGALHGERPRLGVYLARHLPPRLEQRDGLVAYSNYNAALAAYIVERVAGLAFERYLADHVFLPLQMMDTTAQQPPPAALHPRVSTGYVRSDVPPTAVSTASATIYEVGSTGVVTSATDMGRLLMALLDRDPQVVSRRSLERMMMGQALVPRGMVGLGVYSPLGEGGYPFIGHDGGTGAFRSTLALLPGRRFGVFASYNTEGLPASVTAPSELLARIAERYFGAVPPLPNTARALAVDGVYEATRRVESSLFRLQGLVQQLAVRRDGDTLAIRPAFLPFSAALTEVRPGHYLWAGRDVSFAELEGSVVMQVGAPVSQFIRVPPWARASLVVPAVTVCLAVVAVMLMTWPLTLLRRRPTKMDPLSRRLQLATRLALLLDCVAIVAALWLVFLGWPLVALSSPIVGPLTVGIYAVAWTAAALTPIAAWYAVRVTRGGPGILVTARESLLVGVHLILVYFCLYWRIAGTSLAL